MDQPRLTIPVTRPPRLRRTVAAAAGLLLLLASCGGSEEAQTSAPEVPSTYAVTAGGGACESSQYSARVGVMPIVGRTSGEHHVVRVTPLDAP